MPVEKSDLFLENHKLESGDACQIIQEVVRLAQELGNPKTWPVSGKDFAAQRFPLGIWYRGVSNIKHNLTPKAFRTHGGTYDETSILYHFQLLSPYTRPLGASCFEWISLMRHHGFPTRVLDWSESALVALYFAVTDPSSKDEDGCLWVLNARELNHITDLTEHRSYDIRVETGFNCIMRAEQARERTLNELCRATSVCEFNEPISWDIEDTSNKRLIWSRDILYEIHELLNSSYQENIDDPSSGLYDLPFSKESKDFIQRLHSPIAIFPRRYDPRMLNQHSMFTLHGGKEYATFEQKLPGLWRLGKPVTLEDLACAHGPRKGETFLRAYRIPHERKDDVREQLATLGIHAATVYPDIEGYASFVQEIWREVKAADPTTAS